MIDQRAGQPQLNFPWIIKLVRPKHGLNLHRAMRRPFPLPMIPRTAFQKHFRLQAELLNHLLTDPLEIGYQSKEEFFSNFFLLLNAQKPQRLKQP
ncbi:hypothetical protein ATX70_01065 [Oenococcus oeni]|nr:hypothetical protein ATX70_01065 [Oenococcus oeni]